MGVKWYRGGVIPYGYKKHKRRENVLVKDRKEINQMRFVCELYAQNISQARVAEILNDMGHSWRDEPFTISTIKSILKWANSND